MTDLLSSAKRIECSSIQKQKMRRKSKKKPKLQLHHQHLKEALSSLKTMMMQALKIAMVSMIT